MKRKTKEAVKSAGYRALRTFLQAFLAIVSGAPMLSLDVPTFKAAAIAGFGAVLALAQRMLDEAGIRTVPKG